MSKFDELFNEFIKSHNNFMNKNNKSTSEDTDKNNKLNNTDLMDGYATYVDIRFSGGIDGDIMSAEAFKKFIDNFFKTDLMGNIKDEINHINFKTESVYVEPKSRPRRDISLEEQLKIALSKDTVEGYKEAAKLKKEIDKMKNK